MRLHITQNTLIVENKICYMCGVKENLTKHHAIPRVLKPKLNVIFPLCKKCHKKIHSENLNGVHSVLKKIECYFAIVKGMFQRNQVIKREQ